MYNLLTLFAGVINALVFLQVLILGLARNPISYSVTVLYKPVKRLDISVLTVIQ